MAGLSNGYSAGNAACLTFQGVLPYSKLLTISPFIFLVDMQESRALIASAADPEKNQGALNLLVCLLISSHMAIAIYGAINVPIHWDEGWNLCVARMWHDYGHYGCKIDGAFTDPRLATGIIAVVLTKVGFDLFGVDYLAGRFLFLIHLFGFLIAFFFLVKLLFSKRIATIALFIPLLFPDYRVSPALLTTQAHAEVPMCLYITLGYLSALGMLKSRNLKKALPFCALAMVFFGLALYTKKLAEPFLLPAIASIPVALFFLRQYKSAALSLALLVGTYLLLDYPVSSLAPRLVTGPFEDESGTEGLASLLGINTDFKIRKIVLSYVLENYWLSLLGIILFPFLLLSNWSSGPKASETPPKPELIITLSLYLLVLLWTGWFMLLSIHFSRYFAAAATFGSLFSALAISFLSSWIMGTKNPKTFFRAQGELIKKAALCTVGTLLVIQLIFSMKYAIWYTNQDRQYNSELAALAAYLNSKGDILVETYDSQIFHLLDVRFHYPPDQINVAHIAAALGRDEYKAKYDYEQKQPDYILVGEWSNELLKPFTKMPDNQNYAAVKRSNNFTLYKRKISRIQRGPAEKR